jgi:hypothetical protein
MDLPGAGGALTIDAMLEAAAPIVERVVRKRFFGASLSPSDDRYENDRARDCVQQAMLKLWEKLGRVAVAEDPPIENLSSYAARAAHNAVNEVVRPPNWTRLRNRVLKAASKDPSLAVWEDPEIGRVCGYVGWRTPARPVSRGNLVALRRLGSDLRADALLAVHWENIDVPHWQRLLARVFDAVQGPVTVTTLVRFLAELVDIRCEIPLDEGDQDDGHS